MKNIAHRGFSAQYPENTLLAFQKAVEAGCDGIELDLQMTADGRLIILHDEQVDRTTNGTGWVKEMTLAQLRRLDAGQGEPVPTLEEYLDLAEQHPILTNIELKNGIVPYEGMEELLIAEIRRRKLERQVLLSSFNHNSIQKIRALAPELSTAFLLNCWLIEMDHYLITHGVDYLHPSLGSVNQPLIREMQAAGIKVNVWTVNREEDMRCLIQWGVDGIVTNDPALLRAVLADL